MDFKNENDFFEYKKDFWELNRYKRKKVKYEQVLRLYSAFGLMIGVFSIIYFLFITFDIEFNTQQQMILIIFGVGLSLSISSWFLLKIKQDKKNSDLQEIKDYYKIIEYILTWSKFEEVSKKYLISENIKFNKFSIREIIEFNYNNRIFTNFELTILEQAMEIRNNIVHERKIMPIEIVMNYKKEIEKIIKKIEAQYKERLNLV